MKTFINILLIIFALICQIAFFPALSIFGAFPNIILIVAISLLVVHRNEDSLWWFGFGGVMLDLVSPYHFGIYTFSFLAVYLILYYIINYFFSDPPFFAVALFFFFASFISNIIFLLMSINYLHIVILESLYAMFFGSMVYYIIRHYLLLKDTVKI